MTRGLLRFLRGNTIALIALFVALGGTTYAATALPRNSVGTKQLKKNAVTNPKIKNNAVSGAKIANNSVRGTDVLETSLGKVPAAVSADNAAHAGLADTATAATTATTAANATNLGGQPPTFYLGRCGPGSVAVAAQWYAPSLLADPTYSAPNRFGGEGGFACNGGTPEMTKVATGHYRMRVSPALPSANTYLLFVNPDKRQATGEYAFGLSALAGPVWDVYVFDAAGALADPYYIGVLLVAFN